MESILNYAVLVLIGAALLWYNETFFAFYAFMVVVALIIFSTDRLWRLLRLSHASNAGKVLALARSLRVSDADFDRALDEIRSKDPAAWSSLDRDLKNL